MPDLTPADVQAYTKDRLDAADPEVIRMLSAALSVARREVGWHVSPIRTETMTIDGPDSRILWLPTRKLVELVTISENGMALDLTTVVQSAGDGPGLSRRVALRKRSRGYWTGQYSAITLTMEHGYDEVEAADWRQAILSMVDQMSIMPVKAGLDISAFGQSSMKVDDVSIGFNPYASMAEEVIFSSLNVFDDYRLPSLDYL